MSQQRALFLDSKHGSFVVGQRPIPEPGPGELLVKIQAVGINPVDWKIQKYDVYVKEYPAVLGTDIAGDVEEVGEGVEGWAKNDRVFFQGTLVNDKAGFQQYAVMSANLVAKIPEKYSYSQAASISVAYIAAIFGLYGPKPLGIGLNPTIDPEVKYPGAAGLVVGGSTSVGQYAIQLLRQLNFTHIITYASAHHAEYLKSLGATEVIDRHTVSLAELPSAVKKITSEPLKAVYDTVDGAQDAAYACLPAGGELITSLGDKISNKEEGKTVLPVLGSVHLPYAREFGLRVFETLGRLVEDGTIVPNRVEDLPGGLGGIRDGLEKHKSGKVSGVKLIGHPQETK